MPFPVIPFRVVPLGGMPFSVVAFAVMPSCQACLPWWRSTGAFANYRDHYCELAVAAFVGLMSYSG
jgi:hypothetical protein